LFYFKDIEDAFSNHSFKNRGAGIVARTNQTNAVGFCVNVYCTEMNRVMEDIEEFMSNQTLNGKHDEAKSLAMVKLPEQSVDEGLVQSSLKKLKSVRISQRLFGPLTVKSNYINTIF
jgi:predicted transcriptional regulator YheO